MWSEFRGCEVSALWRIQKDREVQFNYYFYNAKLVGAMMTKMLLGNTRILASRCEFHTNRNDITIGTGWHYREKQIHNCDTTTYLRFLLNISNKTRFIGSNRLKTMTYNVVDFAERKIPPLVQIFFRKFQGFLWNENPQVLHFYSQNCAHKKV